MRSLWKYSYGIFKTLPQLGLWKKKEIDSHFSGNLTFLNSFDYYELTVSFLHTAVT
jgi:hypothetical protein